MAGGMAVLNGWVNGWVEWLCGMAVWNGWVFRRETASGFCPFGDAIDLVRGRR